jgi:hypothetical protein
MPTWAILLIIIGIGLVVMTLHQRAVTAAALKAKTTAPGGAAIVSLAEKIPVYGTAVSAVKVVAKPVNHALEKVNGAITAGLQHIPVAGKYLAMPNQIAGSAVHKINSWLGLS